MTFAFSNAPAIRRYLGEGRVVHALGAMLVVVLEDDTRVRATSALAFPYQPVKGDRLLVIGDAKSFFAIGVLEGHGRTHLSNLEGVSLSAEEGRLRLTGDRGIRIRSDEVRVRAATWSKVALTVVETVREKSTQVRERLEVEATEIDEHSDDRWVTQAKRVVIKALLGARMKGSTVRLG